VTTKHQKDYDNGRRWALKVYNEKLKSGDLPRLGTGYPDKYRAAYAVSRIAEIKLSPNSPPLWPKQKAFWLGVRDESSELSVRHLP